MPENRRSRRRRRGGQNRSRPDEPAPQADANGDGTAVSGQQRGGRVDRRRSTQGDGATAPPGPPPGPTTAGRVHRSPAAAGRPAREPRQQRESRPQRERDNRPRVFETPVPQDELSIQLGAAFKEAQVAVRDARRALDKRGAESGDEPEWMVEQLATAEQRFEEAATAWADHLATTGRKVVRR